LKETTKLLRRIIAVASTFVLLGSGIIATPAVSDTIREEVGFEVTDDLPSRSSTLALTENVGGFYRDGVLCQSLGESPECPISKPKILIQPYLIAPACSEVNENCVDGISITTESGKSAGQYVANTDGRTVKPNKSINLPLGSTSSIWQVPGAEHAGGSDLYLVTASLEVGGLVEGKRPNFFINTFNTSISPISVSSGSSCSIKAGSSCYQEHDFNPEHLVELRLKVQNTVQGWFGGRLKSTDIAITKAGGNQSLYRISGYPVKVATFNERLPYDQASPAIQKSIEQWCPKDQPSCIGYGLNGYDTAGHIRNLELWRKMTKDSASGVAVRWAIRSIQNSQGSFCSSSAKGKVLGIVSTNATVFDGGSPKFAKGTLNYVVAGMHYLPGGEQKVLGTYDLVMDSGYARCLYRLGKVPVSATVSVTGSGDKTIATTVVGESKGWLKLAAYGYTFSKKTIKVKIVRSKPKR
jgi:hypothetical protein